MQIFVDDRLIDEETLGGGTLGDALRHVQSGLSDSHQIVSAVRCNGELVAATDMVASLKKPLSAFDRVDVITSTREALVSEAMGHASSSLEESETASQEVARLFIEGRSADARDALADCLQIWRQVHDAVEKSIGLLDMDPDAITIQDDSLADALARPRDVFLQIKQALLAGDEVLLADILQYEFTDVAQTWQAIIARIRREAEDLRDAP